MSKVSKFRAVVFIHTLTSRGRHFRRQGWTREGELYATADEVNEAIAATLRSWPQRTLVVGEKVPLGEYEPHGDTKTGGGWHEVLHGVRVNLDVEGPEFPPPEAWKPWILKSFVEVGDVSDARVRPE